MELKVENKNMKLIQVFSTVSSEILGLYLIPVEYSQEAFEKEFEICDSQDEFDQYNKIGAQRIYASESFLNVDF